MKPVRRPAFLAAYVGEWVAVKDGRVVAHARSSVGLAGIMRALDIDDALIEFVHPPTDAWIVGVG